jgi:hypothetical protein
MYLLLSDTRAGLIWLLGTLFLIALIVWRLDSIVRGLTALVRNTRLLRDEIRRSILNRRSGSDRRKRGDRRVRREPISFADRRVEMRRQRPERRVGVGII